MEAKIQDFKEILYTKKVDFLLVEKPENMRNLSGFLGEGLVFIGENCRWILTDSRYTIAAKEEAPGFEVLLYRGNIYDYLFEQLLDKGVMKEKDSPVKLGYEDEYMRVSSYRTLQKVVEKNQIKVIFTPLHKGLDMLRQVKSEEEIAWIEKAEQIGDQAFEKIVEWIRRHKSERITEKMVAAHLEFYMKELGAEGTSFDTIAASGIHSSMPHAIPTDKVLEEGDFLTMDFGCKYHGYCSDMTRTIVIGKANDRQREIYETVLRAQEAALNAVCAGKTGREIDSVAREIIKEAGYGECFGHSLGHSVGLEIHETPCFSPKDETVMEPGMVITVEPGIYVEGFGGVRIEDVVVITKEGCQNITHSPKDLMEV